MKISPEYDKLWQKVVCFKAYNRCQLEHDGCTSMAYNGAHHIIPRKYLNYRYDMINGFAVCPSCHQWIEEHPKEFKQILQDQHPAVYNYLYNKRIIEVNKEMIDERIKELEAYQWQHCI